MEKLKEVGDEKTTFLLHLSLAPGPRLLTKLSLAPVKKVKQLVDSNAIYFPMQ